MCDSDDVVRIIIPPAAAQQLVAQTETIYLRECPCRVEAGGCSTGPLEVCLLFAAYPAEDRTEARPITSQEALAFERRMADRGMIFNLFYHHESGAVTELCNCCACCCRPLHKMKAAGDYAGQPRSAYLAITDDAACTACGDCLDACFFEARTLVDGALHLAEERCFGCGKCVVYCPESAIRLEAVAGRGQCLPM